MTRNGKIARLPKAVRDQLNRNLQDNVPGGHLLDWLNALPEVQQVMAEQFNGRPINEVNLSDWRNGGFLDWQARQEMLGQAQELAEESADLKSGLPVALAEHLHMVVAGRYAELLNSWNGVVDDNFVKRVKGLRLLCQDVAVMRRGDHRERWVLSNCRQPDTGVRPPTTSADGGVQSDEKGQSK